MTVPDPARNAAFSPAGRLRELLGEASPRPWFVVGPPWNEAAPWINAGSEDPHQQWFVCDFVDETGDGGPQEAQLSEADAELVCLAVNTLDAFLDLEKGVRELLRVTTLSSQSEYLAGIVDAIHDSLYEIDGVRRG